MSLAPFVLFLLIPDEGLLPPERPGSALLWTARAVDEPGDEPGWDICRATDAGQLSQWRALGDRPVDIPLVQIEVLTASPSWLSGHRLVCCSLPVSGFRHAPPAPRAWSLALEVAASLGVDYGWSAPDQTGWTDDAPWGQAHSTMLFSDGLLSRLGLDVTDLEVIGVGGQVYRCSRAHGLWWITDGLGLGNEHVSLSLSSGHDRGTWDDALESAMQTIAGRHRDAVTRWLRAGRRGPGS